MTAGTRRSRFRVGLLAVGLLTAGCEGGAPARPGAVRTTVDTVAGRIQLRNAGEPPALALEPILRLGRQAALEAGDPQEFGSVGSVIADEHGNVYVADQHALEIRVFNRTGEHTRSFGRAGGGPGELRDLTMTGWVGDTLVALDGRNARVALFTREGGWAGSWPWQPISGGLPFLLRDRDRQVYVLSLTPTPGDGPLQRRYTRYAADGARDTVPAPEFPATVRSVVCPYPDGNGIRFFDVPFAPGFPYAFAPDGTAAVVPDGSYRIAFVDAAGDTVRTISREAAAVPVTDVEWEEALAPFVEFRDAYPDVRCENEMTRPRAKPAIRTLLFDDEGRLWLERFASAGFAWDLFDAEGRLVGTAPAPARALRVRPYVRDDVLYQVETDSMDVQQVAAYRLHHEPEDHR